jgi:hypothetical protein
LAKIRGVLGGGGGGLLRRVHRLPGVLKELHLLAGELGSGKILQNYVNYTI